MRRTSRFLSALLIVTLLGICVPAPAVAQAAASNERIYVLGAVNKPGDYEFKAGMDAKQAMDLAGGLAPDADRSGVVLIHEDGKSAPLNVAAVLAGTDKVVLIAGDTIVAKPKSLSTTPAAPPVSASITGEVEKPGTYSLEPGKSDNLDALIESAGGVGAKADLSKVRISNGLPGAEPSKVVDASSAAARRATRILTGDAVFVPQKQQTSVHRSRVSINDIYMGTIIIYTIVRIFRGD